MPDKDGYPTPKELKAIWSFKGTPAKFVEYINSIWWHDGFRVKDGRDSFDKKAVKKLSLSTWGWSGNEEAMSYIDQTWFKLMYWQSHRRGGHYEFMVPVDQWQNSKFEMGKIGK